MNLFQKTAIRIGAKALIAASRTDNKPLAAFYARAAGLFLGGKKRGYAALVGLGGQNSDWILDGINEDADLWQNADKMRSRSRSLWKENPFVRQFATELIANVFGAGGISLQMKVKEAEDRVVYSETEKKFLETLQDRHDERAAFLKQHGRSIRARKFINNKAKAAIKAGSPDVYANTVIERAWKRWKRKENCTVSRRFTYDQIRHYRLKMAARDGGVFIRQVRGFDNEFGYALQLIPDDRCDFNFNAVGPRMINGHLLPEGHEIRLGIEYNEFDEVAAYWFAKRRPQEWMVTAWGGGFPTTGRQYYRLEAREVIHYCLTDDSDAGRAAPWVMAVARRLRHLDKYEESEVIAARAEACKGGHYVPKTGDAAEWQELADKIEKESGDLTEEVEPGMWKKLPFGYEPVPHDPTHPNGNFADFKKEILRTVAAGLPASVYNSLASDYQGVNYTSYKAARIDSNEVYMLIQQFDIDIAEIPIFEAWLEMALLSGAIPLPISKIEKFNAPKFTGRRWEGLEPYKEAAANKLRVELGVTSRTRITEKNGDDLEEIVEEQAFEEALFEAAGLPTMASQINDALIAAESDVAGGKPKE